MLKQFALDRFTLLLCGMVLLASVMPIRASYAEGFGHLTTIAIAILFFLHGAKLSREAVIAGMMHWKLHLLIFSITFILFPVLGLLARPILEPLLGSQLYIGFLFMCFLPSTVQSSIAFTSMAGGNVAAAMCSASFSNIVGMFISPILVSIFILGQSQHGFDASSAILKIVALLLVPFVLGQLSRAYVYPTLAKHPSIVKGFDQGTILMVVYAAFSSAVIAGLWQQLNAWTLIALLAACGLLLAVVMLTAYFAARLFGFNQADQISIFFCASKKTLASGVPMAQILFIGHPLGLVVLPIMLFHQIQLMVCGVIANRWAARQSQAPLPDAARQ